MPYKDPIKRAEFKKQYWLDNKERFSKMRKERYKKNKEQINKKNLENYHKKKLIEPLLIKKQHHISVWKERGIIDDDFDALYDYYIEQTNCMICDIDFNISKKTLDHDHETGEPRYVCCNRCNCGILREL